jgi:putative oxidoreductase
MPVINNAARVPQVRSTALGGSVIASRSSKVDAMGRDRMDTHASQPVIPALSAIYQPLAPYAYAFMRFCVGATIVPHGYSKLFQGAVGGAAGMIAKLGLEPAIGWAYFVSVVEFGGGILLAIGLLTRLAAAMLVIEFAVIVFAVKSAAGFFAFKGGFELELLLGLLCLAIFFKGGGRFSVDHAIGKEL